MAKCKYECNNGTCELNECMYGDFLEYDDSQFGTGRYCFCPAVEKERIARMQSEESEKNEIEIEARIKECQKRRREYMRLIKDIDLMRIAYARSIATETMNIAELKKMKESEKNV